MEYESALLGHSMYFEWYLIIEIIHINDINLYKEPIPKRISKAIFINYLSVSKDQASEATALILFCPVIKLLTWWCYNPPSKHNCTVKSGIEKFINHCTLDTSPVDYIFIGKYI